MRTFCVVFLLFAATVSAQWLNHPTPGTPRMRDGKPNLSASTPRQNGKPDLSGVWHVVPTPLDEMKRLFGPDVDATSVPGMETDSVSKYALNILADFKPEEAPMRPETAAIFRERAEAFARDHPGAKCLPLGLPFAYLVSEVTKIVQTPGLIVMLFESDGSHRQIYTDGRKLPENPDPIWLGYSVGKWQGDTLVVETVGFNDKSWLDGIGHPHSERLRLTERFRRRDFGHLDEEITFDDATMYTRPFSVKVTHALVLDSDVGEFFCNENEKDRVRMNVK